MTFENSARRMARRAVGQDRIQVGAAPVATQQVAEDERVGTGPRVGPSADEQGVERQGTRSPAVVATLGVDAHDHPRPTIQSHREKSVGLGGCHRPFPVTLAGRHCSAEIHSGRQPDDRARIP